jgi:hypothetical protein
VILSFAALLLAAAIGCAVLWRFAGLSALRPRWAAAALAFGAGTACGLGATSVLWFLATLALPGARLPVVLGSEAAAVAAAVVILRRRPGVPPQAASLPRWEWTWILACAVLAALVASTMTMASAWEANPQGNWDAWSIWNLRAKYLAGESGVAARAWSPMLVDTHPEYPLLLSGTVARAWAIGSNRAAEVPMAAGFLFFLSLTAAATGGVALARGSSSGLMTGLVLLCTPGLTVLPPAQYADVPLAAYLVCAVVFVLLDRPLWAGLFAGMAAWTKDEGALFCAVLVAAVAIFRRREVPRLLMGVAPGALLYATFKLLLAPQLGAHGGPGVAARLLDVQRWGLVFLSVAKFFAGLGAGWFHPALPLAAYGFGTGLRQDRRDQAWLCTTIALATLGGYVAVLLTTRMDLPWQINTALDRLLAQWWPLAVVAAMAWVRSAEEAAPVVEAPVKSRDRRKHR